MNKFIKIVNALEAVYYMFNIKFRIVDDFKTLEAITEEMFDKKYNQILGDIQICFGEHKEGSYYHENPLRDDEVGEELLDYWFDKLLQTIITLDGGYNYAAFMEIEKVNRWVEFKKNKNGILINVAIGKPMNNCLFITEKGLFSYVEPLDFRIEYSEFKNCVYETTNKFLMQLKEINPRIWNVKMTCQLREKLELISR